MASGRFVGQRPDGHTFLCKLCILLTIGSIYTKLGDFVKLGVHFKAGTHEGACSWNTLLKHAPETRSRVSTPASIHEGACSWNTLPKHAPGEVLQPVHTRELAPETRSRKANFSTHEGACSWDTLPQSKFQYTRGSLLMKQNRATDVRLELAPSYQTSLIWGSKTREQKVCCATYFFATNRWCRRGSLAPGACCRSVLREQAPSCVPALNYDYCLVSNREGLGTSL